MAQFFTINSKGQKVMNWEETEKYYNSLSDEALRHIAKDAGEAVEALPDSLNSGFYQDEICMVANEFYRRKQDRMDSERKMALSIFNALPDSPDEW